ncbi:MAG: TVP38/TMEM64 family protein [Coriobacteriia bacterium]|nr:TVP38/TMEM64 family protein [Coriobacteriia bacterium]
MWLDGLRLRGVVGVEAARLPSLLLTGAGAALGACWAVRGWRERSAARRALGEDAPEPLVSRRQLAAGIAVAAAGALAYALVPPLRDRVGEAVGVLARGDVEVVRDYLLGFGLWAPVVSSALMILQSLVAPLPAFVVTFSNGLLFGWAWGALLSWSSAMAGAALCFWLGRTLGRPAVERLVGGSAALEVSDLFFERYGDKAVLIARLLPFVSFDIISYGSGLTPIGFRRFFVATGIGQLPATLVYSYLGQNLTGSVRVLFLVFLFTAVVIVIGSAVRPAYLRKVRREAAEEGLGAEARAAGEAAS